MLGDQQLPIYQPGSIMFETAVNGESDISVVHGGSQQNGPVLGNGCAIFLAKFLAKLVLTYNSICEDPSEFCSKSYKAALIKTLCNVSVEDMREHGRLLTLKKKLVSMCDPQDKLDVKSLALF